MTGSQASLSPKTALITGASVGIGYELATVFARHGYRLVLVSRDRVKLEEVARGLEESYGIRAAVLPKDLTAPRAPEEIFEQLRENSIAIHVLVNNAGFGTNGPFHRSDTQKEIDMIQLNVTALAHLTRLFLPDMVERRDGRILNVASTAAFQPGPFMAVYYATKAFVLSFSEAIASELEGTGVSVTTLCPGPTRSEFQKRAGMERSRLAGDGMTMDAATVAKIGYNGLMKRKGIVIPGLRNRLLVLGARLLPRRAVARVVRALNENR